MSEVTSVNGQTGAVVLTAADVAAVPTSAEGQPGGVATLDGSGVLPEAQLPGSVESVSVVPSGGDDTSIIQTAANTYAEVRLQRGATYKLEGSTGLLIDPSKCRVKGSATIIDASGMSSGVAVTFKGTTNSYNNQASGGWHGIELKGPGSGGVVTGIAIIGTATSASSGMFSYRDSSVHDFLIGISERSYEFNLNAYGLSVFNCGTCIDNSLLTQAAGERMTYVGCTFFNSLRAMNLQAEGEHQFIGCSFDFNPELVMLAGPHKVFLHGCHVEYTASTTIPIQLSGTGPIFDMADSNWCVHTQTTLTAELISGVAVTALPVAKVEVTIAEGDTIAVTSSGAALDNFTASAAVAIGATSIPVTSHAPTHTYPIGTKVLDASKTPEYIVSSSAPIESNRGAYFTRVPMSGVTTSSGSFVESGTTSERCWMLPTLMDSTCVSAASGAALNAPPSLPGKTSVMGPLYQNAPKSVVSTGAFAINVDTCSLRELEFITGSAVTLSTTGNGPPSTRTQDLTIVVYNNSGGTLGTITWPSNFSFTGWVWTNPTVGNRTTLQLRYDPSAAKWMVISVSPQGAIFNVKAYGALGTGSGNDGPAIRAADEAASAAGGGTVFFPIGIYRSTETLKPSTGNTWEGTGAPSFINLVSNTTEEDIVVYLKEVSQVKIRNLKIEQANAAARTGVYGLLRVEGCTEVEINDNYLGKSTATGIWAGRGNTDLKIWGNTVNGSEADGIHVNRESKQIRVWGNYLHNTGDDAISIVSFAYSSGNGVTEVEPKYANCENVVVFGNVIEGGKAGGITVWGGSGVVVSDNTINGVEKSGIVVTANTDASGKPKTHFTVGATITGNSIRSPKNHGIIVIYARDVTITGNRIYNPTKSGIFVNPVAVDLTITGNRLTRCGERGVLVEQVASTEARLLEELFSDVGDTAPTSIGVQGLTIVGNGIRHTTYEGIRILGESGAHVTAVTIAANRTNTGVTETWAQTFLKYVDNFTITGNNAANGSYRGFQLEFCAKGVIVGNQAAGQLNAELTKVSLSEVKIYGNSFIGEVELTTETPEPSEQSLLGWSFDAAAATAGTVVATAGTVHFVKVKIKAACTIHNVILHVATGGSVLTSGQCFAALYNEAGELLSTTADQHTEWLSTGLKTMALAEAKEVSSGHVYVAFFYNGTTAPSFARGVATSLANAGVSGTSSRFGTANTGRTTTMPAKLEGQAAESVAWWSGVS